MMLDADQRECQNNYKTFKSLSEDLTQEKLDREKYEELKKRFESGGE